MIYSEKKKNCIIKKPAAKNIVTSFDKSNKKKSMKETLNKNTTKYVFMSQIKIYFYVFHQFNSCFSS